MLAVWLTFLVGCSVVDPFESVRARIALELKNGAPSVSIAVARRNRIVWEDAFGWADREQAIAATPNTIYTLGSASKPITATAIMILRDRGLLDLDRPANEYLGDARLIARVGQASQATIRRVAQHVAGLPDYYETFYADESAVPPSAEEVIRTYAQITSLPGKRFQYSNLDYVVLGEVISRVSGQPYAQFLLGDVFVPLGMGDSGVVTTRAFADGRATRYLANGTRLPNYVTSCTAAADVEASVHDLVHFGMIHLKTSLPSSASVLSARSINEMQQSNVAMGDNRYGIGWVIHTDSLGRRRVGHGGAGAGVDAQLTLVPDEDLVVAVLINAFMDRHVAGEIADLALDSFLREAHGSSAAPRAPTQDSVPVVVAPSSEFVGAWDGVITTQERNISLKMWINEDGAAIAELDGQPPVGISDLRIQSGKVSGRMESDIRTTQALRRPHDIDLEVTLRDGRLEGTVNAIGRKSSRGLGLPYWVQLRKCADG